jgi:hypothetical protein
VVKKKAKKSARRPAAAKVPVPLPPLTVGARLRQWLLTGLLILGPSALTLWVLYRNGQDFSAIDRELERLNESMMRAFSTE